MKAYAILTIFAATLVAAQNPTTVDLFIPTAYDSNVSFAASIVGACSDQTLYQLRCTEGIFASTITCGSNGPTFTITEGPRTYAASTTTKFSLATMTLTESCVLHGTHSASCAATMVFSSNFKTRATSSVTLFNAPTLADFYMYKVQVTAGAENIKSGICSSGSMRTASVAMFGVFIGAFIFTFALVL